METQKIEMVIQTSHVNIKILLTMNEAVETMNRLENTIKEAQQPVADMIKKVNGNASPEIKNMEPKELVDKAIDWCKSQMDFYSETDNVVFRVKLDAFNSCKHYLESLKK